MLAAANSLSIELNHAMLKQKILPISPLIQCDAGRAKKKICSLGTQNGCHVIKVCLKFSEECHRLDVVTYNWVQYIHGRLSFNIRILFIIYIIYTQVLQKDKIFSKL